MEKEPQGTIVSVFAAVALAALIHFSYTGGISGLVKDGTDLRVPVSGHSSTGTTQ